MAEHVPHPQGYKRLLGATGPVRPVLSSIEDTGLNQVRTIGGTSAQGRCAIRISQVYMFSSKASSAVLDSCKVMVPWGSNFVGTRDI